MPSPRPIPVTDLMAAMRCARQSAARKYGAEVEKHARQITLELHRGQSVTNLLRKLREWEDRLSDEQKAIDLIDEWAARMKRAVVQQRAAA